MLDKLNNFIFKLNETDFSKEFSQSNNIVREVVDNWVCDEYHGLFHSSLVAFFAWQNSDDSNFEKLMASCLLHDFVKSTADSRNHDQRLKEYFPELTPDVYTHANPSEETPLVIGDRIELRRYDDWNQWVNIDIKKYTKEDEIVDFYKNIRPHIHKDPAFINCMKTISKQLYLSCA
jgi:hypothetical protein